MPETRPATPGDAAQRVAFLIFSDPERRQDALGEIFLICDEIARSESEAWQRAAAADRLDEFLAARVRSRLEPETLERVSGGWLGTFLEGDARPIESDAPDTTDRESLDLCRTALQRAESIAAEEGNSVLQRNLRWYRERLAHKSYAAIARAEDRPCATVRTGVARARKVVLRIVHELQTAQPAPLNGEAPPALEALRQLWVEQNLDALAAELERTRAEYGESPHWLNLAGLVASDRGRDDEAIALFERGLVHADAPSVRARLLNNLGNLVEDRASLEEAEPFWLRAHQLVGHAPAPLLNLIVATSLRRDYACAQHYLSELGELLGSERLDEAEREYVLRRLQENPRLHWLRETDAWRHGPERWLRDAGTRPKRSTRSMARRVVDAMAAAVLAFAMLAPQGALARTPSAPPDGSDRRPAQVAQAELPESIFARGSRGGDSMGKPPRRGFAPAKLVVAGDSMGRTSREGRRRR